MIVARILLSDSALQDNCLLFIVLCHGMHVLMRMYAITVSSKSGFNRFAINHIEGTK